MQTYDMTDYHQESSELDHLPPEALLDPNNPANDDYLREIASLKRLIVSQSHKLSNMHVNIVKKAHLGKTQVAIADELGITNNTVSRALKAPKAKRLHALLSHLALMMDGPREGQRRNFLWRIAVANEEKDPRTAISAIAEINKMTHQDKVLDLGNNGLGGNTVQIVINNEQFPRGALD